MKKIPLFLLLALFSFSNPQFVFSQNEADQADEAEVEIPATAVFKLADLREGEQEIVCCPRIVRRFMGTRATPPFLDTIKFYGVDGNELRFAGIEDEGLKAAILKQLVSGYSRPVLLSVNTKSVRVGHDGINMSQRMIPEVLEYQPLTIDAVRAAAKDAGIADADVDRFEESLAPNVVQDGVAVSLENVFIRSKANRSGSGLAISGIQVFNSTADEVTIKLKRVWTEQGSEPQQYELSDSTSWTVAAESWSDGIYTDREMPKKMWQFKPSAPIEPGQQVTMHLEIQINEGEVMTLTRTIDPK